MTRMLLLLLAVFTTGAFAGPQKDQLADALGTDPVATLRSIGSAPNHAEARELAEPLRDSLSRPVLQALLRFGLGHPDERVVFGAAILFPDELPPVVPELKHAARVAIARFGDADCPLSDFDVINLAGSVDVPALLSRIPHIEPDLAESILGQAHRILRAEHVPLLCALALQSEVCVARVALSNAELVARYSDQYGEIVLATTLQLAGRDLRRPKSLLPPVLYTALEMLAEAAQAQTAATKVEPSSEPQPPAMWRPDAQLCARWISRCTVTADDLPLLERLLDAPVICFSVMRAFATIDDPRVEPLLRRHAHYPSALFALARRGDEAALEELLADSGRSLALGLAAASPERRRAFASNLLAEPPDRALETLERLAWIAFGVIDVQAMPYDDEWLIDLEALAASAQDLDVAVLRAMVAQVPTCATRRLADRLIAASPEELFAPLHAEDGEAIPWEEFSGQPYEGELGFSGPWAFLEVTRPQEFRRLVREGMQSKDPLVRDVCADLLLRMSDREIAPSLWKWVKQREKDLLGVPWLRLAAVGGESVQRELQRRVVLIEDEEGLAELLIASAVAAGMPPALTTRWFLDGDDLEIARTHVLERRFAHAWLDTRGDDESLPPDLVLWNDPKIQQFVEEHRAELGLTDQLIAATLAGDNDSIQVLHEFFVDGRYATHHVFWHGAATRRDLSQLEFWIAETGTNCCRYIDSAADALQELFGRTPTYHMSQEPEPLRTRLRRHLLSRKDRLRWSKIAGGFVVAGN